MILNFLLNIVYIFVSTVISIIPDSTIPDFITDTIATVSTYFSAFYSFLPFVTSTLIAVVGIFITIEGIILLIKVINWFIRKIPFLN